MVDGPGQVLNVMSTVSQMKPDIIIPAVAGVKCEDRYWKQNQTAYFDDSVIRTAIGCIYETR